MNAILLSAEPDHTVVFFTDLSGKDPHRQVGVDKVIASWSLGGVMVNSEMARSAGSKSALGTIFPIFITAMTLIAMLGPCTSYIL